MTIYVVFFVAVILLWGYLLGDASKKTNTLCLMAAGVFLVAMMTLRYSIGYDYFSYNTIFEDVRKLSFGEVFSTYGIEQTFYLLCKLVSMLGGSYRVLLLVCNLIMVGSVLWVIYRYSPVWWLSVMLYVALQFMPHSMNLLRQSLAASVLFFGWGFLKEGKPIKYLLVVLLAATFHFSAIIMLPAYFLLRLPYNRKVLAAYGGAALVGYLAFWPLLRFVITYMVPKYSIYLDADIYGKGNGFTLAIPALVYMVAALLASKLLLERDRSNGILIYSAVFTFVFYLFMSKMYIVERFSIYFFMYAMLLLPEIAAVLKPQPLTQKNPKVEVKQAYKKGQENWQVAMLLIVGCALCYFAFSAFIGTHKAYPYVGMWEPERSVPNSTYFQDHS